MTIVTKKDALAVGIKDSHITFIKREDDVRATYENETIKTPNIKELKITKEGESQKITASNTIYDVVAATGNVAVTYNVLTLDAVTQSRILGRKYENVGEYSVHAIAEDGRPEAFGFTTEAPNNDGSVVFLAFPKLKASKEIEDTYKDMGSGVEETSKEFLFESLTTGSNTEYYIHTSPIKKEHVEAMRAAWHANPVQSIAEAKKLVETTVALSA